MTRLGRLAAALAIAATPAAAFEGTRFDLLWIEPNDPAAMRAIPALLNLPAAWQLGDAAAVLLVEPPGAFELRDHLLSALLDRGAAVLELDASTARGFSADADRNPPPPDAESLLTDLDLGLRELRRYGAGVVVAIGHGLGGEAVLLAAERGLGFVAHAALGPGEPAFIAGPAPPPVEGWVLRAPLLCEALAWAHAASPTPRPTAPDILAREAATQRACVEALATRPLADAR